MQIPFEVDAIGNLWHQSFGKTHAPVSVLILDYQAKGIAACIGCIVIATVVIHGPVQKLKMAVGTDRIEIEKISHAELAGTNLQSSYWQLRRQRQRTANRFDGFTTKRDDLMDHQTRLIRLRAESRIAYDIEVGKARETERVTNTSTTGTLNVEEDLCFLRKLESSVQSQHP